jgi:Predicted transcriptional regulators
MQIIQIGANISKLRKEKGITQEALAEYLGVSKPAVSKWESGQSYPDILLLPVIASYFNQSVDELLGYEAQMSPEDVKKLYIQLADAFATKPFDAVYARCKEIVKKYYSCWKLLFSMAQLWVNHAPQAGRPDRINAIYEEAAALFERVERESDEMDGLGALLPPPLRFSRVGIRLRWLGRLGESLLSLEYLGCSR